MPQNDAEAAKWFRLAANQGVAKAQFNLGIVYATGQGASQERGEMRQHGLHGLVIPTIDGWNFERLSEKVSVGGAVPFGRPAGRQEAGASDFLPLAIAAPPRTAALSFCMHRREAAGSVQGQSSFVRRRATAGSRPAN